MEEPPLHCKLRCNFRPSVHSFPYASCGDVGFRKRTQRDAVTGVVAEAGGKRVSLSRDTRRAREARAKTEKELLASPTVESAFDLSAVRSHSLCFILERRCGSGSCFWKVVFRVSFPAAT